MARGEIKIPMSVDTSGIAREIDNGLVEPLEDVEDALKALSKVDAGKDLERDLEKAAKATKDLDNELDDTRDKLKKLGFAAKDAGDDAKKGMNRAEDGVKEFGEEANSTAKESAASFDGSAESIADAFQEIAANAFAGFGPAGAIAGLALAAGIGIGVQKIEEAKERVEELQEIASEIHLAALEEGVDVEEYTTGLGYITEALQRLNAEGQKSPRWFWDEDQTGLQEFVDDLRTLGETQASVTDIMALNSDEMGNYRDAIEKNRRALQKEEDAIRSRADAGEMLTESENDRLSAIDKIQGAQDRSIETLDREIETRAEAAEQQSAWAESGAADAAKRAEAEEEAASRIEAAAEGMAESVASSYDSMRSSAYELSTAEDQAFTTDNWIAYTEAGRAAAEAYAANVGQMKLSTDEAANFLQLPEDARSAIAASYATAGEDGKLAIRQALSDTGIVSADDLVSNFNPELEADVDVQSDTAAAEADLEDVSRDREAEIKVKTTGKADAKSDLDDLAKKRHATIDVRADVSDFNASVNTARRNQENRPVYITVKFKNGGSQLV